MMETKKVIILITEGASDAIIFDQLNKYIWDSSFMVYTVKGDMFSHYDTNQFNVDDVFEGFVSRFLNSQQGTGIRREDIKKVYQLFDTDGCFSSIHPPHLQTIREVKGQNVRSLYEERQCLKEPLMLCYSSTNLEHVLFGKAENKGMSKTRRAINFVKALEHTGGYLEGLINFFNQPTLLSFKTYDESMEFIMKGENSKLRKSNVKFMLEDILGEA